MIIDEMRELRETGVQVVGALAGLVGAMLVVWGLVGGAPLVALSAALLVAAPVWFAVKRRCDPVARMVIAVTYPLLAGLLLAMASGTGWLLDMHMLFFAFLAVLAALADWRAIVVGTVVTALHHLLLNFVAPAYVFPNGADLARVLFHALVVLIEAGVLIALCRHFEALIRRLSETRNAEAARDAARHAEREAAAAEQREVLGIVSDRLGALAAGDLAARLEGLPPQYRGLETDLNAAFNSLCVTLGDVVIGMDSMTSGANEIRSAADDLSRRTEEQAANLEETAAAIAGVNASVQESAASSAHARRTIAETTARARDGVQIVSEAVGAMQQIENSSQEINSIIAVINGIAFQTNLLALNAGVEAARAGEAGKGFAVVANEVRALAQRCADAADEVKALISASSVQVGRGVDLVGRSGNAFAAIMQDVTALSDAIQTIADSAATQAENLSQVTGVVSELDRSTQQNAAMAEECTAAATSLTREARLLNDAIANFNVGPRLPGHGTATAPLISHAA